MLPLCNERIKGDLFSFPLVGDLIHIIPGTCNCNARIKVNWRCSSCFVFLLRKTPLRLIRVKAEVRDFLCAVKCGLGLGLVFIALTACSAIPAPRQDHMLDLLPKTTSSFPALDTPFHCVVRTGQLVLECVDSIASASKRSRIWCGTFRGRGPSTSLFIRLSVSLPR